MLKQLTIRNFAIIDDLSIDFEDGLNVFTGETGAGKSIIIDAISLLTGERADTTMIKDHTKKAFIEGVFILNKEEMDKIGELLVLDSDVLVVNKEIYENKTTCRINSRITTLSTLKTIMKSVIDIHSQHDNLYLLDKKNHQYLLDQYNTPLIAPLLKEYQDLFYLRKSYLNELEELNKIDVNDDEIEFLTYQKEEIEKLELEEGEIEDLEAEMKRFKKFEVIATSFNEAINLLDDVALGAMYNARKPLETLAKDELFEDCATKINDLYYDLDDKIESLKDIFSSLDFNEERINAIQSRLFEINKIQRKYGKTYEEIMARYDEIVSQLDTISNVTIKMEEVKKNIIKVEALLLTKGNKLDKVRKDVSKDLTNAIIKELNDLYLNNVKFEVKFTPLDHFTKYGFNEIEFYVSLNAGQELKPLIKVASGGEVSRLMLGLKVIFNRLFNIQTTIFDEVDTGVSGKVARAMGLKMLELSSYSQVIAITHLPQVASLGNNHYFIKKLTRGNNTYTVVKRLSLEERIEVIASMLSSNEIINENSYNAAKDLLNLR